MPYVPYMPYVPIHDGTLSSRPITGNIAMSGRGGDGAIRGERDGEGGWLGETERETGGHLWTGPGKACLRFISTIQIIASVEV